MAQRATISDRPGGAAAARRQAALEMIAREGPSLRQTARRYSICADDAEDAYQRALEIALTKGPADDPRELIRWTQVVTKHEALAIRRKRERMLGNPARQEDGDELDWVAMLPAKGSGPDEAVELRERIARSREALSALKPAELRALTLLAEGYSYAEIGEITGFSRTKVNRCLAEGRERFRRLVSRSEDGSHCEDMAPLLSAFCDGEADPQEAVAVREHLRACAGCRATMRSYRETAGTAAALAPLFAASGSLLERLQELGAWLHSRLPGGSGAAESAIGSASTTGGAGGLGATAIGKAIAACAVSAGAAACVATGVIPAPVDLSPKRVEAPTIERVSPAVIEAAEAAARESSPASAARSRPEPKPQAPPPEPQPAVEEAPPPVEAGAVEYEEAVAPPPAPPTEAPEASTGNAAGEFGP